MQTTVRVRAIRRRLSDIESRIAFIEKEIADLVDDLWFLDDVVKITKSCRACVRELRRQLAELESH